METKTKFVLHKHNADRAGIHYDLRIKNPETNLVWSWALPKSEIPTDNKVYLAILTHDNSKPSILNFSGTIEKDNYGSGTIEIEDSGECIINKWLPNMISFTVKKSKKLIGSYHLIMTQQPNQWLFIKSKKEVN